MNQFDPLNDAGHGNGHTNGNGNGHLQHSPALEAARLMNPAKPSRSRRSRVTTPVLVKNFVLDTNVLLPAL